MPPGQNDQQSAPPSPLRGPDRIGALPDELLHHLLSFLPVESSVRTCVLARRWRHLWRSTTGLRIADLGDGFKFTHLRRLVDHLLILRERTDLDTVEIRIHESSEDDDVHHYVNLWARYAVMCKVRVLKLDLFGVYITLPLLSRHLRTLHLQGAFLEETFLDFANCLALEDLKMSRCYIGTDRISSRSLKRLTISNCNTSELHVSTPGLISLELVRFEGIKPFLENMAFLETAYVDLDEGCEDFCLNHATGVFCGANDNACSNCLRMKDVCNSDCPLLRGISSAKHLKLLSESRTFIFTRDLKHCPTFSKLKTLLLNEYWCEAPNLDPLACILKKSPVLEKLTLQLFSEGPKHRVEMKGSCSPMEEPSAISKHLNMVEIKCSVVDERIHNVLKFLSAFNIRFDLGENI